MANKAVKELHYNNTPMYSTGHYMVIYTILCEKLKTLPNRSYKIAYIDCLIMNYTNLQSPEVFDLLISIISGSSLGISFFNLPSTILFKGFSFITLLFSIGVKLFLLTHKKYAFYLMILKELKNTL